MHFLSRVVVVVIQRTLRYNFILIKNFMSCTTSLTHLSLFFFFFFFFFFFLVKATRFSTTFANHFPFLFLFPCRDGFLLVLQ